MVEGGVDDARRHPLGDERPQGRLARTRPEPHPVAVADAALLGVVRVDFEPVLPVPAGILGAAGLRPDIVLAENAPGRQQQREARPGLFVGCHVFGADELALAAHEAVDMHDRRAGRRRGVAGPLHRAFAIDERVAHAGEARRRRGDLVHDFARMGIAPAGAQNVGERHRHLPVGKSRLGRHDLAHTVDAPLGIGEGSVLFEKARAGQEDMGVIGRFVDKEVVDDDAVHGGEAGGDVARVGVGLQDVLALDVEATERAVERGVEHVGDPEARFAVEPGAPQPIEQVARRVVGDVAVSRQFVRERAHVARPLDVVLAPQRVHSRPWLADIARCHGEIGDGDDGGRALRVLGDAEAIVDGGVAAPGVEPGGGTDGLCRHARQLFHLFRRIAGLGDERRPVGEFVPVAAGAHEGLVAEPFGDDHMGQGGQYRDIGAGPEGEVMRRLDVGGADEVDAAWIDDDELRSLPQAPLEARGEDRMAIGRVGANDHDDIRLFDTIEILGASRRAEGGLEAVAGRRMADAGAGVDIVVAKDLADELLHEEGLLVGTARRGDAADGTNSALGLDFPEARRGEAERFVPGDFAPWFDDGFADHRRQHAVAMGDVAPGEATLDTGMAAIGLAVLIGDHAHQFLAAHLGLERTADAAIGAGGDDGVLRLADGDDALFGQGGGRAGGDAGPARHALGGKEVLHHPRRDARVETPAGDGQGEGALHLVAGPNAARADDAFARVVVEIGIRLVLDAEADIFAAVGARVDMVVAVISVAHVPQADGAGHVLQLAIAVGGAGQAIERDGRRYRVP